MKARGLPEKFEIYDGPEAHVYAQIFWRRCYLHIDVKQWSKSTLRFFLSRWPGVVRTLKTVGIKRILTYPEVRGDPKFPRFVKMFGFEKLKLYNGYMIYEYKGV